MNLTAENAKTQRRDALRKMGLGAIAIALMPFTSFGFDLGSTPEERMAKEIRRHLKNGWHPPLNPDGLRAAGERIRLLAESLERFNAAVKEHLAELGREVARFKEKAKAQ